MADDKKSGESSSSTGHRFTPLTDSLDPWRNSPETVKRFLEQSPDYERLCEEVAYVCKKRLKQFQIEYSSVTYRVKTLKSFLQKIQRKNYGNAFSEVTDFAGVRITCLYISDVAHVASFITSEFQVIERIDKLAEKEPDQFGYGALHLVVKLKPDMGGARYEDLKNLVCEIQVRTVLQDAWATIDHHLAYKSDIGTPTKLRRKLSLLAAKLEEADSQFDQLRRDREEYLKSVESSIIESPERFLSLEMNSDSLLEFMKWKFPNVPIGVNDNQIAAMKRLFPYTHFRNVGELNDLTDRTKAARERFHIEVADKSTKVDNQVPAASEIFIALLLGDDEFYANPPTPLDDYQELVDRLRAELKKR